LLDQALREVLGTHVEQKGSLNNDRSLRFDFSHFQKVTPEELRQIERIINGRIRENIPFQDHRDVPIEEAKNMGAIALFGEKYGDRVRVVQFGDSVEFCGGTHVSATGKLGLFRIVSESSVAAGIRRIEAITGEAAEESMYLQQDILSSVSAFFNNAKDVKAAVQKAIDENADLKKQMEAAVRERVGQLKGRLIEAAKEVDGVKVIAQVLPMDVEAGAVKDLAFQVSGQLPENTLLVLGSKHDDKPLLTVMVSKDLIASRQLHAGNLVKEAARLIQGGGGGAPHFATAGGKNTAGLDEAVAKVLELAGF